MTFKNGHAYVVRTGRFVAKQYIGTFVNASLQVKADTGLWYAFATGTGLKIEGEGATSADAFRDLRQRAHALRNEITQVYEL